MKQRSRWQAVLAVVVFLASPQGVRAQAPTGQALENLVAPIALYPDALVAQILPAATQPIQVVEAARAVANGQRPSQSIASQWNPSVQALVSYPTVLKMMNDKLDWTTQLGQAFVANQGAVMTAIQQVRHQAQAAGNLKTTEQQTVTMQGGGSTSTIIIEPANPQYIYVPQYNPVTILQPAPVSYGWGAPLMTFGVGFAAGAATAYACDWGHYGYGGGTVNVNDSYHYNQYNTYAPYNSNNANSYSRYNPTTGTSAHYNPSTGMHTGYNANTGTYGAYNSNTGKYTTYDPSSGSYNRDGNTGTYPPPSSTSDSYHPPSSSGSHSWDGSGGDAFHGMDGGGWGARDASSRGGGDGWGGGGDRGGGGWGGGGFGGGDRGGGGGGFGGGSGGGGFRGGGFGGRRR
jgi:uncharacterized membrane protein YgcG